MFFVIMLKLYLDINWFEKRMNIMNSKLLLLFKDIKLIGISRDGFELNEWKMFCLHCQRNPLTKVTEVNYNKIL